MHDILKNICIWILMFFIYKISWTLKWNCFVIDFIEQLLWFTITCKWTIEPVADIGDASSGVIVFCGVQMSGKSTSNCDTFLSLFIKEFIKKKFFFFSILSVNKKLWRIVQNILACHSYVFYYLYSSEVDQFDRLCMCANWKWVSLLTRSGPTKW